MYLYSGDYQFTDRCLTSSDHISHIFMTRKSLRILVLLLQRFLTYLTFQSFDSERTWWTLFQKRVVSIKFDIYVSIVYLLVCYTFSYTLDGIISSEIFTSVYRDMKIPVQVLVQVSNLNLANKSYRYARWIYNYLYNQWLSTLN
jgi:hypothetical protein